MKFYKNQISKYWGCDINLNIGLKWYYWSEDYYNYSDNIIMIDILTDPI